MWPLALVLLAVLVAAGVVGGSAMADPAANLETTVDPLGRITTYTHDADNRLTVIDYSDGKTHPVKYKYDGNIVRMADGTGVTVDTYDELGRLIEVRNERGEVVSYKYNLEGKPIEIIYPNHKSVTRAYDRYGRLKEVTDWNSRTTKFSYGSDGNLTAIAFPSETANEDRYTYDSAGKMSGATMLRGTEVLASLHYGRDGDGQVKLASVQGLPGGEAAEYVYGENDRLTRAGGTEYAYDSVSNPTKIDNNTYTYNSADELEAGAGMTYTYNEAGQRVEAAPAHGSATTYSYDQAGNLITVQRPGNSHEPAINDSYSYDGNGLRSSQTVDGTTSNLAWDTAEELPLLLSDGTNSYIYGPDGLPIEQISNTGTTLYFHHDQQGSTRLLTNTKGEVEASYAYNPYGKLIATTGTATTPLLYDGQYTNTDTGLIYLRARSYDPTTAQFLTVDPALQVTGEPYAYAGDSPLNHSDPTGKQWWAPWQWDRVEREGIGMGLLYSAGATAVASGGSALVPGGQGVAAGLAIGAGVQALAGGVLLLIP
jgi:RHS repeat-associated protein